MGKRRKYSGNPLVGTTYGGGLWQIANGNLLRLLNTVRAKEATRYALEHVLVDKGGELVVTDGRQLLCVQAGHKAEAGKYRISREGYMLVDSDARNFPNYDALLHDPQLDTTITFDSYIEHWATIMVLLFGKEGFNFNGELFWPTMHAIEKCEPSTTVVHWFNDKERHDRPMRITCQCEKFKFTYLQMPISGTVLERACKVVVPQIKERESNGEQSAESTGGATPHP